MLRGVKRREEGGGYSDGCDTKNNSDLMKRNSI